MIRSKPRGKPHEGTRGAVGASLVEVLCQRGTEQSQEVGLRFLTGGGEESESLTYAELDDRARTAAAWLQTRDLQAERAILMYDTGPDYAVAMLACLYAGVVAVPLYPCLPNRSADRLRMVIEDAQPAVALANPSATASIAAQLAGYGLGTEVLAFDRTGTESASNWQPPVVDTDTLAYLQYTSGSTVDPKGVMITHGNLVHNCELIARVVDSPAEHCVVSWLPFFHDMGLVGGLFFSLYQGFPLILMPPESFVMRPMTWLRAISKYRGTLSPAPNFAFEHCVDRTTPEQRESLDLSSWQFAFNGAERINLQTLDRFAEAFATAGFRRGTFMPCYGLAESTLFVTGGSNVNRPHADIFARTALNQGRGVTATEGTTLVSCGNSRERLDVLIVDPDTRRRCAAGVVGEIWVAGPSVAAGYWKQPELTVERFEALEESTGAGPYLRTGDLGLFSDGELYVTGRLKDLVIIGGQNICPEDIEVTVESAHPAVRPGGAIAFSVDTDRSESLAVVAEVDKRALKLARPSEIENAIRDAVARTNNVAVSHLLLLRGPALPRTASGKKRRSACRTKFLQQGFHLKHLVEQP